MLKYLGLAAIFLAAVVPAFEYGRRSRQRLSEYELFISLTGGIYNEISIHMRPLSRFLSNFDGSAAGLKFSDGADFSSDFLAVADKLLISESAKSELGAFFSALGASSRDEEMSRALQIRDKLRAEYEKERAGAERGVGAVRAVCCAVGLTLVILLI